MVYQVLEYERDRWDTTTEIRNLRRMGFRDINTAERWATRCRFAEIRESSPKGAICIAVVINHKLTWRTKF